MDRFRGAVSFAMSISLSMGDIVTNQPTLHRQQRRSTAIKYALA